MLTIEEVNMKRKIKRFLSSLLMAMLVLSMTPTNAFGADPVCKIIHTDSSETEYEAFSDALAAVQPGETIQILEDITYTSKIVIEEKSITFDVNGHVLFLTTAQAPALEVGLGGELKLVDSGTGGLFNVEKISNNTGHGVLAHDGGKVTVSNVHKTDINTSYHSIHAMDAGSSITVLGNVSGGFYSLGAYGGATITVYGYLSGGGAMQAEGFGTTVNVMGYSSGGGTGVIARDYAVVNIGGNVYGGGWGVMAHTGAQVTVNGYVNYRLDGASWPVQVGESDREYDEHEPTSSKDGYFEYKQETDGKTSYVWVKRYYPNQIVINISYIYEGSTVYDDQNESSSHASKTATREYNFTLATAPNPAPTMDGFSFVGWFTEPDGGGLEWVFGAAGVGTTLTDQHDVNFAALTLTLYAFFEEDLPDPTYTVTFAPGLHGTFTQQETTGLAAGDATPAAPTPTGEAGWVFDGWQPTLSTTVTGDVTYVAQWVEDAPPQATYTVTFAPGLHGTFTQQETTGLAAGSATPAAPTPTGETGWVFSGWLPSLSTTVTGNVVYVAQWTRSEPPQATYTVTFAPGLHGTFKSQVTSGLVAGSATPKAPTPTAESGWVFNGWQPSVSSTVTGDVIYVAQWTKSSTPPVIPATGDYGYQLLILLVGAGSLLLVGGLVKRVRKDRT
jgi:hypothetical protein